MKTADMTLFAKARAKWDAEISRDGCNKTPFDWHSVRTVDDAIRCHTDGWGYFDAPAYIRRMAAHYGVAA